jgi:DNA-binding NarL/FixJ family response regulator
LKQTVAILEPHHILRQCLEEILIYLNYSVIIKSGDPLEFIEQLALSDDAPDIILSEVELNDMQDISLFRHFRHHYPGVKILAFSADDTEWTVQNVLQEGAHAFLEKGCSLQSLQDMLANIAPQQARLNKSGADFT